MYQVSRVEAEEMGRQAFSSGKHYSQCPFINWGEGHKLWMSWNNGFEEAKSAAKSPAPAPSSPRS
jgi:hypothetical protein